MALLINVTEMDRFIEEALDKLAEEARLDFVRTMETWQTHRPTVNVVKLPKYRKVYILDPIYTYINDGTPVRRALLSKDWKSKTKVRTIQSGPGSGKVLMVSKKFNFKGIQARQFDQTIQERIVNEVVPPIAQQMVDLIVETV